jgi:hypothetical protein
LRGEVRPLPPAVIEATQATHALRAHGFQPPAWDTLTLPGPPQPLPRDAGDYHRGWQRLASTAQDRNELAALLSDLDPSSRALLHSQAGPYASRTLTVYPTNPEYTLSPEHFRVCLLRRLRLPLPFTNHRCSCGGALDPLGDHRAACATSGFLRVRPIPLERAVARICREAGGRVRTNMNLPCPPPDARAIEVLISGVPLWHGAQIAIDATLVSPIHRNGEPRPRAASEPGVTLNQAARRKRTQTYPEFQSSTRCRLAVFGLEVGGRWSPEAVHLVRHLARARARTEPTWARSTAAAAWALRWAALASIAAMRALAASLLDFPAHGEDAMDGPPPPPPAPRRNPVGGPPLTQPLAPLTQCKDLSFLTRAGGFGGKGKKIWKIEKIYPTKKWGCPRVRIAILMRVP